MSNRSISRGAPSREFKPGTIKRLLGYMSAYKLRLIFVVVCILISASVNSSVSLFMQILIDDHIVPMLAQANPDYSGMLRTIVIMALIFIIGVSATFVYNRIMAIIEQNALKRIRDDLFRRLQTLPIPYFDTHQHGDTMSRFTNDTDTLRQALSQSFPQMLSSVFATSVAFISMMYLSLTLTAIVLVFAVIILNTSKLIVSRSSRHSIRQQESLAKVNAYIEEMVHGQKVVKVFNYEEKSEEEFERRIETLYNHASEASRYGNITMPVIANLGYALYVTLATVGGLAGIFGIPNLTFSGLQPLSIGTIISFLTLSRAFVNPIGQISMQFNMVVMALAGASRIFTLMDEKEEQDEGFVSLVNVTEKDGQLIESKVQTNHWAWKEIRKDEVIYTPLQGDIRFSHVHFAYTKGKEVLHDITLYAEPGQKVALVGATGAGKTTITNLINRFYDIDEGVITYDGIDIRKIRKPDLRSSLGIVLQDVNLFTGTVMENIRYGKLDATDEECIGAAKRVHADEFIRMLPKGYDTMLEGDGSGLSQGQRQLISIARAAVANPPVMILDEATSSIDTRTEAIVQKGMDALMKGRTVFVIAHRLSTVQNSDVIMVMDHGRIIERGSHDSLLEQKGTYYQLYTGAFELE